MTFLRRVVLVIVLLGAAFIALACSGTVANAPSTPLPLGVASSAPLAVDTPTPNAFERQALTDNQLADLQNQMADVNATRTQNAVLFGAQTQAANATEQTLLRMYDTLIISQTQVAMMISTTLQVADIDKMLSNATQTEKERQLANKKQEVEIAALQVNNTLDAEKKREENRIWYAVLWAFGVALIAVVLVLAALCIWILGRFFWRASNSQLKRLDAIAERSKLARTPSGDVYYWDANLKRYVLMNKTALPAPGGRPQMDDPETDITVVDGITVNDSKGKRVIPRDKEEALRCKRMALFLLDASVGYIETHADWPKDRLPGSRELGWSGGKWHRHAEKLTGYITRESGGNGGTFTSKRYPTVFDLYEAVNDGRVKF